jgi:hypothetical protein
MEHNAIAHQSLSILMNRIPSREHHDQDTAKSGDTVTGQADRKQASPPRPFNQLVYGSIRDLIFSIGSWGSPWYPVFGILASPMVQYSYRTKPIENKHPQRPRSTN